MKHTLHLTYKLLRRIVIFVVGMSVVLVGVIMFVTPGPAIVVIPAGLAILSLEFAWARHWLKLMKEKTQDVAKNFSNKKADHAGTENPAEPDATSSDKVETAKAETTRPESGAQP